MPKKLPYKVGVYDAGHWVTDVFFRWKWQARRFHISLNRSINHAGTREY